MCRNIKTLFNFEPPATADEVRAGALQFVRKLSGFHTPSRVNQQAFEAAVEEITVASVAAVIPRIGQVAQEPGCLHHATSGHQVLVLGRAGTVGEVHVPQPRPHPLRHRDRVGSGDRGVRQVDGLVGVGLLGGVPARHVHLDGPVGAAPAALTP